MKGIKNDLIVRLHEGVKNVLETLTIKMPLKP